jgi:phage protein D
VPSPEQWTPYVRITTPDVFLPFYVKDLVVHSEEGQHQWAQLTVRYYVALTSRVLLDQLPPEIWWPENRPVRLVYGPTPSMAKEFVGYVVSPEIVSDDTQQVTPHVAGQMIDIRYTMLGATKPLQTVKTRAWSSCTAPYMASEIVESNGLGAVTSAHPRVFPSRQQAESDFAFLRRMADEIGWRLVADGTTVYFTDPRVKLSSRIPSFRQNHRGGIQDTMQAFNAVTGDLDPAGTRRTQHETTSLSNAGVISSALDAAPRSTSTGQVVEAQVRQRSTTYVARSYAEAQAISAAAVARNLWWATAAATVDGDVDLAPGCVVELGGTALTSQYAGQWMTRAAHHRLSFSLADPRLSSYYVDLTLGRDQADRLTTYRAPNTGRTASVLAADRWVSRRA